MTATPFAIILVKAMQHEDFTADDMLPESLYGVYGEYSSSTIQEIA